MTNTKKKLIRILIKLEQEIIDQMVSAQAHSLQFNRSAFIREAIIEKTQRILGGVSAKS